LLELNRDQAENRRKQLKAEEALMEKRLAGDFMKPFPSFYDARGLEPPMTE
jgi:hypothetical protein